MEQTVDVSRSQGTTEQLIKSTIGWFENPTNLKNQFTQSVEFLRSSVEPDIGWPAQIYRLQVAIPLLAGALTNRNEFEIAIARDPERPVVRWRTSVPHFTHALHTFSVIDLRDFSQPKVRLSDSTDLLPKWYMALLYGAIKKGVTETHGEILDRMKSEIEQL